MTEARQILVFQPAFLGDVVLTTPLVQVLHRRFPAAAVDVVVDPRGADALRNHPSIRAVVRYDKRGMQSGPAGIFAMARTLRATGYDVALVPHRSFRSALVVRLSGIPIRVGFSTSSGKMFLTHTVPYVQTRHEIERNLSLLGALNITVDERELPALYPSPEDRARIDAILFDEEILETEHLVAIAPGSVWNTKRWPGERFAELSRLLADDGYLVVLVGGTDDAELCRSIQHSGGERKIISVAGSLSVLQSAELIRRARVLVTNDSAPLHLAVAMRTPVVALFGATVPAFGFGPYGDQDCVVETDGLSCRPCSIHGGNRCPIGTFECMLKIEAQRVYERVKQYVAA